MEHYINIVDDVVYYNDKPVERIVKTDVRHYTRNHGKIKYSVEAPMTLVWVYVDGGRELSKEKQEIMTYAYDDATGPFFNWSK